MIFDDTESYPYLAIARHFGVDYGLVLRAADYFANRNDDAISIADLPLDCRFRIWRKVQELGL